MDGEKKRRSRVKPAFRGLLWSIGMGLISSGKFDVLNKLKNFRSFDYYDRELSQGSVQCYNVLF